MDTKFSNLYDWYNYRDRNELAAQFYSHFTENIDSFPFREDFSICLCANSEQDHVVYLFVDILDVDQGKDQSVKNNEMIRKYLHKSDCPESQGYEDINFPAHLAIDDVEQILGQSGINIIRGLMRKAGTVLELKK